MTTKPLQLILAAAVCVTSFHAITRTQTATPKAKTILSEMVTRYQDLSSYQDSGIVRLVPAQPAIASSALHSFRPAAFEDTELVSFKTSFARPRMFRFDWKSSLMPSSRNAVIWSDGKKVYSWMPSRFPRDGSFSLNDGGDLQFYIDEAQGSSAGAAYLVPSMLIKEASPFSFADYLSIATEVLVLKQQDVDGASCYVISATLSGAPWTFWIDKKEHVLRKTRTLYSSGSFHENLQKGARHSFYAEEIHRDIRVNKPIAAGVFKYAPQLQARDIDLTH